MVEKTQFMEIIIEGLKGSTQKISNIFQLIKLLVHDAIFLLIFYLFKPEVLKLENVISSLI